jgi:hypothetical protein
MENNATIISNFASLIAVLDPKSLITVWEITAEGKQKTLYSHVPVYTLYEGNKHGDYKVVGITTGITTDILIEKGE